MRENKNRVLVTGASGFVGRHALRALAELGYEVHAVSRAPEEQHRTCGRWHCGNLLVAEDRERILRETRPTHLLHLAWETDHGKFWASPKNLDWLVATVELLHCFAVLGGARFVGAGTCFEYDSEAAAAGARLCLESETALGTKTLYDCTKSATFHVAAEFCRLNSIGFAWGRLFFPYGPGEKRQRLIPSVILALLQERPVETTEGSQVRDFIHAEDAGEALAALLASEAEGPVNIGSGEPTTVKDIVLRLGHITDRKPLLRIGALEPRPGEPPCLVADTQRLRREVGFHPRFDLEHGLEDTVDWWRARIGAT